MADGRSAEARGRKLVTFLTESLGHVEMVLAARRNGTPLSKRKGKLLGQRVSEPGHDEN
jgi:hypothetical protein